MGSINEINEDLIHAMQPVGSSSVPTISNDPDVNARAMSKLIEIAQALGERFGYDPRLVLEDMFRDLRLINGEEVLAVLDPNNPIDELTSQMYSDYRTAESIAQFLGINLKNAMLRNILETSPEECCDKFQQFIDAGHQIPFAGNQQIGYHAQPRRLR